LKFWLHEHTHRNRGEEGSDGGARYPTMHPWNYLCAAVVRDGVDGAAMLAWNANFLVFVSRLEADIVAAKLLLSPLMELSVGVCARAAGAVLYMLCAGLC
jgi:hypothetical protein